MLKLRFKASILPQCLMLALLAGAAPQTALQRKKTLTPEQGKYQARLTQWRMTRQALKTKANAALAAERQREKIGDCPHADTTRAAEDCLSRERETTQKNYLAFTSALRSMLALSYPVMPGEGPITGTTGTPSTAAEQVQEFDRIEALSKKYRDDAATVAYNQFKGGTEAPVFAVEAQQKLIRLHLQELAFIYGEELSNH